MPTEERKKSRRARTTAMLERVDQELAESERERRDPRRGVVLSAIRWEIAARSPTPGQAMTVHDPAASAPLQSTLDWLDWYRVNVVGIGV